MNCRVFESRLVSYPSWGLIWLTGGFLGRSSRSTTQCCRHYFPLPILWKICLLGPTRMQCTYNTQWYVQYMVDSPLCHPLSKAGFFFLLLVYRYPAWARFYKGLILFWSEHPGPWGTDMSDTWYERERGRDGVWECKMDLDPPPPASRLSIVPERCQAEPCKPTTFYQAACARQRRRRIHYERTTILTISSWSLAGADPRTAAVFFFSSSRCCRTTASVRARAAQTMRHAVVVLPARKRGA